MPLYRREYDCFVSYASEDQEIALRLVDFLTSAGLSVWFDQHRLRAGAPVIDELARQVKNSRAFILVATHKAINSAYVQHEVDTASDEAMSHSGFTLLAALIAPDLELKERFSKLGRHSWVAMTGGDLNLDTAYRLLLALTPLLGRFSESRNVYVSHGWRDGEQALNNIIFRFLDSRNIRMIGDSRDQKSFGDQGAARVERLMSACSGFIQILPARQTPGKTPAETYRHFTAEKEICDKLDLMRRTFCVSRVMLPPELQSDAIEIGNLDARDVFEREIQSFLGEIEPVNPYIFFATDYILHPRRNEFARTIIESVLEMRCMLGKDYPSDDIKNTIVSLIGGANMVFVDAACSVDEPSKRIRPNVNTCIEAGIALGLRKPLLITAIDPDPILSAGPKTAQMPFMLRNHTINYYRDDVHYLAEIHRLARVYRRRIINDELVADYSRV